jgi:baseplate J-like protein
MAAEPIHVEVDEDVPAIVDRLRHSRSDEIHLVLPARARFGQTRFNFQLLKQYSMRLGKRVAIVSPDPGVQRLAEESGFGAFKPAAWGSPPRSPLAAPAGENRPTSLPLGGVRPRNPNLPQRARLNVAPGPGAGPSGPPNGLPVTVPSGPAAARLGGPAPAGTRAGGIDRLGRPVPSVPGARIRIGSPRRLPVSLTALQPARYVLYGAAGLLLLAGILATVFYVPSARVTLVAQAQTLSTPVDVTGAPEGSAIHVRVANITKQASITGPATGTKTTPGQVAVGEFVYVNACNFDLDIPTGQRLHSVNGAVFAQLGDAVVPGHGGVVPVSVKAVQPGQNANVGAGQITGIDNNQYQCLTGTNQAPTAGGTDDQKQTVIQTSDIQSAKAQLEQQLRQPILDELGRGVQKGEKLAPSPIFVGDDFSTDHPVDDPSARFTATLKVTAEGDYYASDEVDNYFADQLKTKVPANQQLTSNKVGANYSVSATQGGHLDFNGQAVGYVAPRLDINKVSGELVGKTSSQARDMLNKLPVRRVEIQQTPLPFPVLPFSSSRIYIDYVIDPAAAAPKPV